jgi:hypothetical protein
MKRRAALAGLVAAAAVAGPAPGEPPLAGTSGAAAPVAAHAALEALSGEEIYARVLRNRFRSFTQASRLVSADRSGREQETRFVHWKDFRGPGGNAAAGVLSKAVVRYTHPFDLRYAGYLVQANAGRSNDQFIYSPSRRKVVRVNLRSEAVHGTDFSFEDVIPRELEDATYRRLTDAELGGIPVHVVELVPRDRSESEYSKVEVSVDRERFVPLRSRYWDAAGVEIKELSADPARVRDFDGVWVPMEATMRHLLFETWTRLVITDLVPNPPLGEDVFDLGRLESH